MIDPSRNFGLGGTRSGQRCPSDEHRTVSGIADGYPPSLYSRPDVGLFCAVCGWRAADEPPPARTGRQRGKKPASTSPAIEPGEAPSVPCCLCSLPVYNGMTEHLCCRHHEAAIRAGRRCPACAASEATTRAHRP